MRESIPWVFYVSEMGRPIVKQEIVKLQLSRGEFERMERLLARIATGQETWRDSDHLGRAIWEARLKTPQRQLRLLFSKEESPYIHLALLARVKKTQKTPPKWIETALSRRSDWLRRLNDAE